MLHSDASVITHLKFKPDSKNWFVVYSISIFTDCVFPYTRFLNFRFVLSFIPVFGICGFLCFLLALKQYFSRFGSILLDLLLVT